MKIVSTVGFLFAMRIEIPNPSGFPVLDWGLPTSPCPRIGRGGGVCHCADAGAADLADAVDVGQIGPSNSGLQLCLRCVLNLKNVSINFAFTFELSILPSKFFLFGPHIHLLFPCHSFARGLTVSLVLQPELIQRPTEHSRAFETVVSSIIVLSGWARNWSTKKEHGNTPRDCEGDSPLLQS